MAWILATPAVLARRKFCYNKLHMKNYSTILETIIAFLVLIVVVCFMVKVKYYQYLEDQRQTQTEVRQEK